MLVAQEVGRRILDAQLRVPLVRFTVRTGDDAARLVGMLLGVAEVPVPRVEESVLVCGKPDLVRPGERLRVVLRERSFVGTALKSCERPPLANDTERLVRQAERFDRRGSICEGLLERFDVSLPRVGIVVRIAAPAQQYVLSGDREVENPARESGGMLVRQIQRLPVDERRRVSRGVLALQPLGAGVLQPRCVVGRCRRVGSRRRRGRRSRGRGRPRRGRRCGNGCGSGSRDGGCRRHRGCGWGRRRRGSRERRRCRGRQDRRRSCLRCGCGSGGICRYGRWRRVGSAASSEYAHHDCSRSQQRDYAFLHRSLPLADNTRRHYTRGCRAFRRYSLSVCRSSLILARQRCIPLSRCIRSRGLKRRNSPHTGDTVGYNRRYPFNQGRHLEAVTSSASRSCSMVSAHEKSDTEGSDLFRLRLRRTAGTSAMNSA